MRCFESYEKMDVVCDSTDRAFRWVSYPGYPDVVGNPWAGEFNAFGVRHDPVPDFEHGLDFRSLDDAVAYARRCLSAGYDRTGNWDRAQTCRHLTDWLRAPLEGPPPMPWLMRLPMAIVRLIVGPLEREQTLDVQIVHCMHHFGHLKPHSRIVADTVPGRRIASGKA
jgi:hypothetical protein